MLALQKVLVGIGLAIRVLIDVGFAKDTGVGFSKGYW